MVEFPTDMIRPELNGFGGVEMDHEVIKNDDIIQLKQMIIFLKAELIKYETMDSIAEMNKLKQEVRQLSTENEQLAAQLDQRSNPQRSEYKQQEMTIDWTPITLQLEGLAKMVKGNGTSAENIRRLTEKLAAQERVIEQYEVERIAFQQEHLLLGNLERKISVLEQENEKLIAERAEISPEVVEQMDAQMREVIQKAFAFEEHLKRKLAALNEVDAELMALIRKRKE